MTDLATAEPDTRSTVIDAEAPADASGGGVPRTLETEAKEPAKEPSLRDTVAAAVKESAKEESKPDAEADKGDDAAKAEKGVEKPKDEKAAPDAAEDKKGAERAPDGKFAAKKAEGEEAAAQPDAEKAQKPNGHHIEPPKNFLPDAKETWRNTPRAVQRDIQHAIQQHEAEVSKFREAAERYEPIREFDDYVRQNGRAGVHETLAEVAQLEDLMGKNPIAAVNQILLRAGPRKADGSPINLFELAQHIVRTGQDGYNKLAAQPAPQQQQAQPNVEVEQLKQQLAQMQEQQLAVSVIEPFKRDHPRYDELKDDIALFLKSGRVPSSLSPHERLEAAYDMAVRINPASHANDAAEPKADPDPGRRAEHDFSGSKSIKSAPGAVSAEMEPERGGSIRDLIAQEMKRAKGSR